MFDHTVCSLHNQLLIFLAEEIACLAVKGGVGSAVLCASRPAGSGFDAMKEVGGTLHLSVIITLYFQKENIDVKSLYRVNKVLVDTNFVDLRTIFGHTGGDFIN